MKSNLACPTDASVGWRARNGRLRVAKATRAMLLCAHLSPLLLLHAGPALADEDFAYPLQPDNNP